MILTAFNALPTVNALSAGDTIHPGHLGSISFISFICLHNEYITLSILATQDLGHHVVDDQVDDYHLNVVDEVADHHHHYHEVDDVVDDHHLVVHDYHHVFRMMIVL